MDFAADCGIMKKTEKRDDTAMLTIYTGPDHRILRKRILEDILQQVNQGREHQYLLVPEQYSFEAERQLCRLGGDRVCRFAEVLSLTRLASRVESIYGGAGCVWLDGGGRLLAAAQAVEQVSSRLKLYAGVCRRTEFLEMFLAAVDEFGSYGITPDRLIELSNGHTGQFAQKLAELGLLYESYQAVCTRAQDPVVRLQNLRDVLAREDFAEERDFYILGFTDFTRLEGEIVEQLILSGRSVTLALPGESVGGAPVFPTAAAAAASLRKFCARHNVPFSAVELGWEEGVPSALMHLQQNCSRQTQTVFSGDSAGVYLGRFASREEECRAAARRICELVEQGASFHDIVVVCTDLTAYRPVLRTVLERSGIPYFLSGKTPISENPGAGILLFALRAVAEDLEQDVVLDYLKCGAVSLSDEICDRLENYARLWNIRGSRWTGDWTWHPRGLADAWTDGDREYLERLNGWRRDALEPLLGLRAALRKAGAVGTMARAVYDFSETVGLSARLQKMADQLFEEKNYALAQQYGQVYDILLSSLEQICMMLPEASASAEEFCRLYEKLLAQYSVGAIPAAVDQVSVGELHSALAKNVEHLIILGAEERKFPTVSHGCGVFTEEERRALMEGGLPMAPLRANAMDRELGTICSVLRTAEKTVSVTCAGEEPSFLLRRLGVAFGDLREAAPESALLDEDELSAHLLRSGAVDWEHLDDNLKTLWEKSRCRFGSIAPEHVRELYGQRLFLSASRIDRFAGCRFSFFMRYGLKAETGEPVRFDASAFGTFVHAVLEDTAAAVMERGGFASVSPEELSAIADSVMDAYAEQALRDMTDSGSRFRFLFSRNREEAQAVVRDLGEEMRLSDFTPAAFELEFGEGADLDAISIRTDKAESIVSGFVDRVDLCRVGDKTYVRVVDYKTGTKDFDYADLTVGSGLQMLIYLFALRQSGKALFGEELTPAGVLYQPAKEPLGSFQGRPSEQEALKAREKTHTRKGLLLDEDDVLQAMEHFEGSPRYLPFTVKKTGRSGDLASAAELEQLEKYVFEKLRGITDEIYGGDVTPDPVLRGAENSACRYCDFKDVCQKDLAQHKPRRLRAIQNRAFFKEIEEEGGKRNG